MSMLNWRCFFCVLIVRFVRVVIGVLMVCLRFWSVNIMVIFCCWCWFFCYCVLLCGVIVWRSLGIGFCWWVCCKIYGWLYWWCVIVFIVWWWISCWLFICCVKIILNRWKWLVCCWLVVLIIWLSCCCWFLIRCVLWVMLVNWWCCWCGRLMKLFLIVWCVFIMNGVGKWWSRLIRFCWLNVLSYCIVLLLRNGMILNWWWKFVRFMIRCFWRFFECVVYLCRLFVFIIF